MSDTGSVVRLGLAAVVTAAAARCAWQWLRGSGNEGRSASSSSVTASPTNKRAANGASSPAARGAGGGGGEQDPSEGLWIYFGSQSGTAEGFAKELSEEAEQREMKATVVDMENFDPDDFVRHKTVVIVVATYGEGDPPDNAIEFFKWLQDENLPEDTLKDVQYTVMGLGNRQYVNFNATGRAADEHMARLGATSIYARGEGDDDQNIEEDFEQWKEHGLWHALRKACGLGDADAHDGGADGNSLETAAAVLARLPLLAQVLETGEAPPSDPLVQVGGADVLGKWYFSASLAPVTVCEELRQKVDLEAGRTTKHIEFSLKSLPGVDWRTADNLEVLPQNPDHVVEAFAARLGVAGQLDKSVAFVRAPEVNKAVRKPFPSPCSLRTALGLYCDLSAAPHRQAARRLGALVKDAEDRAALEKLLLDRETYSWLTGEQVRLTLEEFFELFMSSASLELGAFLQLCPRQKSRPYTISSSYREDPKTIGICVSMVQEPIPDLATVLEGLAARGHPLPRAQETLAKLGGAKRVFKGLCSTMLCTAVTPGEKLWINARASSFRLPRRTTLPIIMIAAGTGIAPMRAFVREFRAENGQRAKTTLIFGCTKREEDFLYREELADAQEMEPPALAKLVTAFSREQAEKIYVQHRLRELATEVAEQVAAGGYIYVCGGTSMGRSIREELAAALGGADYVNRLHTEGRFVEELW